MDESNERSGLRRPPVTAKGLGFWVAAIVIMIAVSTCLGLLIVHALAGSVGEFDLRVEALHPDPSHALARRERSLRPRSDLPRRL